eukprot:6189177-Pleurochrysis_carterae.AAC.5
MVLWTVDAAAAKSFIARKLEEASAPPREEWELHAIAHACERGRATRHATAPTPEPAVWVAP